MSVRKAPFRCGFIDDSVAGRTVRRCDRRLDQPSSPIAALRALVLVLLAAALPGCAHGGWASDDPSSWAPGQVLSESRKSLGKGYREVQRSIVNPPGHWEGVGHFSFVYFRDVRVCQCSSDEVVISPDGQFAAYAARGTGALMLFHAPTRRATLLAADAVGSPRAAAWDLRAGTVEIMLRRWDGPNSAIDQTVAFSLPSPR